MIFFFSAVLLLVIAIALGSYAGRSANLRVRRFFWLSLVLGLSASALVLGVVGEWWLALGPALPLLLILLLRLRFPFLFGQTGPSFKDSPGTGRDNEETNLYNGGHEKTDTNRDKPEI
ncbi:MAG: hypothetical protein ACC613_01315 [Synergistales bacterium]